MDKKQIQKSLNIFTQRVKKTFKPERILLFGSYANGRATDYSDIDIVVVADKFKKIPQQKRIDRLYELTQDLYPDFHVIGFTPEEFNNASSLITLEEIKKNNISLM